MTIIAVVIVFNEERLLPGCLESVHERVERMVVVDGAYEHFPHEMPWSTDATREIAWCYGAEWIPCPVDVDGAPRAWHTQVEKRTAYLVGEEGDWYLHVDADERLIGELPERLDGEHYAFQVHTRDMRLTWVPRLWQHRGRMRYEGAHNALWTDERLMRLRDAVRIPWDVCHLRHLSHLRDVQRQLDKRAFLPGRYERERAYRELLGI